MILQDTNIRAALADRERLRRLPERIHKQRGFLLNPHRFGGGGGAPTDPYFSNVSLLMHMAGSNGSTSFTDNSPSPKTLTAQGNAQISTAQSKFGGSSAVFDGSGDAITSNFTAGLNLYNTDCTVEGWVYLNNRTSDPYLFSAYGNSTNRWAFQVMAGGALQWFIQSSAAGWTSSQLGSVPTGQWVHLAICVSGSTIKSFIDGTITHNTTIAQNFGNVDHRLELGSAFFNNSNYINGYLDEVRITKGVARYASNFTPPTEAFPNS